MHPADARSVGVTDGDLVRVFNQRGEVRLPVEVNEGLAPGTVLAPGVWWIKFSPDGRTINQLVSQQETDMGASAVFYDTLVQVARVEAEAAVGEAEILVEVV